LIDIILDNKNNTMEDPEMNAAEADAMNMAEENSKMDDAKSSNKSTKIDNIVE
jgi:hypothetical protein